MQEDIRYIEKSRLELRENLGLETKKSNGLELKVASVHREFEDKVVLL